MATPIQETGVRSASNSGYFQMNTATIYNNPLIGKASGTRMGGDLQVLLTNMVSQKWSHKVIKLLLLDYYFMWNIGGSVIGNSNLVGQFTPESFYISAVFKGYFDAYLSKLNGFY